MPRYELKISGALVGERLDLALVKADLGLSRRKIRRAIDLGGVYVNRKRVRIASRGLKFGDQIALEYDAASDKHVDEDYRLTDDLVLGWDDDYIVFNKPPGIAAQPTRSQSVFHMEALVTKFLKERGNAKTPILVHRLDRETSGVMLFALNPETAAFFNQKFKDREITKIYDAVAIGIPKAEEFTNNVRLHPADKNAEVKVAPVGGKSAYTEFVVLRRFDTAQCTLIECHPKTGRTHQIRVHLEHLGLPLLGDKKYGHGLHGHARARLFHLAVNYHMLHARLLRFTGPDGKEHEFIAPRPDYFESILTQLGNT